MYIWVVGIYGILKAFKSIYKKKIEEVTKKEEEQKLDIQSQGFLLRHQQKRGDPYTNSSLKLKSCCLF